MSSNLIVNNIEVGAGATIYTAASNQLAFGTNGSEKVRIASDGQLRIGTTSTGTASVVIDSALGSGSALRFIGKSANGGSEIDFYANNNSTRLGYIEFNDEVTKIVSETDVPFKITTNGGSNERLCITSAGRVGIGSEIPNSKLEVWNGSNIEVLRLKDTHFNKYLTIRGGGSPNRMVIDSYEGGGGGADIDFASNGSTKVRITSGGQVNIGTGSLTQTDRMLNVYGGRMRIEVFLLILIVLKFMPIPQVVNLME